MSRAICIIGKSYCGKDYFINKLKDFTSAKVIYVGDEMRKQKFNSVCVPSFVIENVIENCIDDVNSDIIIDNAFKNIEQAKGVIKILKNRFYEIQVILVTNQRTEFNIKDRGRVDDENIIKKWDLWNKEFPLLYRWLLENQTLFSFKEVFNTDNGILI